MYSVVLMMALSGGAESADFGHKCGGCTGAVAASCHGERHKLFHKDKCHGCAAPAPCAVCPPPAPAPVAVCSGCHGSKGGLFHRKKGCHGAPACAGGYIGCAGAPMMAPGGPGPKEMPKEPIPTPPAKAQGQAPATIFVSLPADARLSVDGMATSSTSDRRMFVTPALETGADYVYTFRAEVGSEVQTRQVTVRGGQTTNVPFSFAQSVASR